MKKIFLGLSVATTLILTGCGGASKGISMGNQEVKHYFSKGEITKIEKVVVDKTMLATLTGTGIGAVGGAVIGASKGNTKDALAGGVIGAGIGAIGGFVAGYMVNGNEMEAYEVDIKDIKTNTIHKAYLENFIEVGTKVEFVNRENKITNINLLAKK